MSDFLRACAPASHTSSCFCPFAPSWSCVEKKTPPSSLHLLPLPLFHPSPFITRPVLPSRGGARDADERSPPHPPNTQNAPLLSPEPRLKAEESLFLVVSAAQVFSPPPPSRAEKDKSRTAVSAHARDPLPAAPRCQTVVGGGQSWGFGGEGGWGGGGWRSGGVCEVEWR